MMMRATILRGVRLKIVNASLNSMFQRITLIAVLLVNLCCEVHSTEINVTRDSKWYEGWNTISIGDSRSEVLELLGEPSFKPALKERETDYFLANFGYRGLEPKEVESISDAVRSGSIDTEHLAIFGINLPIFRIDYRGGRVVRKMDSIGGGEFSEQDSIVFISEGNPTAPKIVNGISEISVFPRYLDIRWMPSSGAYPMHYEIEISVFSMKDRDRMIRKYVLESNNTWVGQILPGRNLYSIRVRAINHFGASEWSEPVDVASFK